MSVLSARASSLEPSIIREMSGRRRPSSIDLSLGEPALPPDPELLERAYRALLAGPQGYTLNAGLEPLRAQIAAHHGLPGRSAANNVIVTVGSEEAVCLAMMSTLDPGDQVLVPDPGYPAYRGIAKLIGAEAVPFPIERARGLVARAETIAPKIGPKTKLLILNSPSNPFGTIDTADELVQIAALADRHGLTVLSDEIYRDLYYGAARPPSIADHYDRVLVATGLSKSCAMTGLRLGYLIGEAEFMKKTTLVHQLLVTCAPRLAQLAALEVFAQPKLLTAHVPYYRRAREAAQQVSLPVPLLLGEAAFYAILPVDGYGDDPLALALELLDREDVVVVPGVAFGKETGRWFWRLSYAAGPDAVREGLLRVARFLGARSTSEARSARV